MRQLLPCLPYLTTRPVIAHHRDILLCIRNSWPPSKRSSSPLVVHEYQITHRGEELIAIRVPQGEILPRLARQREKKNTTSDDARARGTSRYELHTICKMRKAPVSFVSHETIPTAHNLPTPLIAVVNESDNAEAAHMFP